MIRMTTTADSEPVLTFLPSLVSAEKMFLSFERSVASVSPGCIADVDRNLVQATPPAVASNCALYATPSRATGKVSVVHYTGGRANCDVISTGSST